MPKIVIPGDFLATEEEYSKGYHTYYVDGTIHAALLGKALYDSNKRTASVYYENSKDPVKQGDLVYASVESVKENFVAVKLLCAFHEQKEKVLTNTRGRLFISEVSSAYIKNLKSYFKIGDIIKARVKEVTPFLIFIQTNDKNFGVVKAYCTKCRSELHLFNKQLKCINCGNIEERKLSNEYGIIKEVC